MRYKIGLGLVWLVAVGLVSMTPVSTLGSEWVEYEVQGMRMSVPPTWVSTGDEETFIEALDEAGEEYPELKTLSNGVTSLMNESVDTLFLSDTLSQTNLNLGVASNPDGLPSDAELEMIAAVAPKKLEDMGKEFGIEMQVLDARILMLPTGKAIQTYSEVIFNSELTPATISQYQYIFVTEELFYYLNLSTPQVLFEGMAPIFERIAHTIRIDDYPDSWMEHTDETGQISLRLPSVWGQNATTAAQPA
ncbi:MAG: hypothetical protein H7X77_00055, partial [Anaerolineae bacterium]|nr:hypothetical protein [Anaerolineae bacterium]